MRVDDSQLVVECPRCNGLEEEEEAAAALEDAADAAQFFKHSGELLLLLLLLAAAGDDSAADGAQSGDELVASTKLSPSLLQRESTLRRLSFKSWNKLILPSESTTVTVIMSV